MRHPSGFFIGKLLASALGVLTCTGASAYGLFTVGGDDACSFHDLQEAIDAATDPEGNTVFVTRSMDYTGQHVQIFGGTIAILGGLDDCSSQTYSGVTTIRGTDGHSVFEIEDSASIYMGNLYITGASMGAGNKGGGIYFGGDGALELSNVTVGANTAGYGGGIDMSPGSGPATLTLDAGVYVIANTAIVSGGGIRIEGDTRLYALKPDTWITSNEAESGDGGGVEIVGPARADIAGSGLGGGPIVDGNTAQYGGGIDVIGTSDGDAILRLFTTDPAHPVQVSNNVAYETGGAIYLKPTIDLFSAGLAVLCAYDFRLDRNSAQDGSAIYDDEDATLGMPNSGYMALNTAPANLDFACIEPEAPPALGAVACAPGVPCNTIHDNVAQQADGTPTDGSTILLQSVGLLVADRVDVRGNVGGHVLREAGSSFSVALTNSLLAENTVGGELIASSGDDDSMSIDGCTIAANSIGGASMAYLPGGSIWNSLIDQPGLAVIDPPLSDPGRASYLLAADVSTLPDDNTIALGEPTFVDAANGDYHLAPGSLGIDFAPADANLPGADLDRLARVVDLAAGDVFGPMDLGAYELQTDEALGCLVADTVFCDGFDP